MASGEIFVNINFQNVKQVRDAIARLQKERDELRKCLEESVGLQSHYAWLLNEYDGGERMIFKTADEWIERLRKIGDT